MLDPRIDIEREEEDITRYKSGDVIVAVKETKTDERPGLPDKSTRTEQILLWGIDLSGEETEEELETMAIEKLEAIGGVMKFDPPEPNDERI